MGLLTLSITSYRKHSGKIADRTVASEVTQGMGSSSNRLLASGGLGANYCENLHQAVCTNMGTIQDHTGWVKRDIDGERKAIEVYETIIHEHPEWSSDQVDDELSQQIFTPKRRQRLQSAFEWVEFQMERFIDSQTDSVFSHIEKRALKTRLRSVQLQLPPPASVYADEPDLLTKNDVYYERLEDGTIRLRVGGAYLFTAKSWYNIVFTFAHELAHSIDPCELRSLGLSYPAYDRIGACLMSHGVIAARRTRTECGQDDQLSEAFSDWMAAQIVSKALSKLSTEFDREDLKNALANSVRDLCEQDGASGPDDVDTSFHPSPKVRISEIFGHHPVVRSLLGCEATPVIYCTLDWQPPLKQN